MAKHKYNYAKAKTVPTESVCISIAIYLKRKQTRILKISIKNFRDLGMFGKA